MDHRHAARLLAVGRMGAGALLLVAPGRAGGAWAGPEASRPATKLFIRALGIRDLALGVGLFRALDAGDPQARTWLDWGAASDAVDAAATLLAFGSLPARGRLGILGLAVGATAVAVAARDGLD